MITTLYPKQTAVGPVLPARQGRSKKSLRSVIEFDGRVFIARYEGRPSRFFGASTEEAHHNLQVGGQ
jgi:hypothetical protein